MGRRVEVHLLREGVGEGSHSGLGGGVGREAREAVERNEGAREDEMAGRGRASGHCSSRLRFRGFRWAAMGVVCGGPQPCIEDGVRHVDGGEVVAVHHSLELRDWRGDEQRRMCAAATTPDDVRRRAIPPRGGFGDHPGALRRGRYVGADIVKALSFGVPSASLGKS